ncbi:MAG TPA: response regulator [Bryobacteraceae bacterium]|jgi:FixJ family two-component response regulator|nr:response regulator [Bryobacteraceae bacterium]
MKIAEDRASSATRADTPPRRVSIVDDDASIREALKSLMRAVHFSVEAFASAEEFLASERVDGTDCLILDVFLPGMSGFELQNHLNAERRRIPIVFITAHSDESSRQRALNAGAIDFLGKPVRRESLFKAIQSAFQH